MALTKRTVRLNVTLNSWEDDCYSSINYRELCEKHNDLDVISDETEGGPSFENEEHPQMPMTSVTLPLKRKKLDLSDFRGLGIGYEEDSFIDDTETCDESVVSDLYQGFYMHSETEHASELNIDSECESAENVASFSSNSTSGTDAETCLQNTADVLATSEDLHKLKHSKKIEPTLKTIAWDIAHRLAETSSHSLSTDEQSYSGLPYIEGSENLRWDSCETQTDPAVESHRLMKSANDISGSSLQPNAREHPPLSDSSIGSRKNDTNDEVFHQTQLPPSIIALLEIEAGRRSATEKKRRMDNTSEIVLELGEECRKLPAAARKCVLEELGRLWNCSSKTASNRMSRIKSRFDEKEVEASLLRLRSQLIAEMNIGLNHNNENCALTPSARQLLYAAVHAKRCWLERHPPRKGDATQALLRFTHEQLLPLWPASGPGAEPDGAHAHVLEAALDAVGHEVAHLLPPTVRRSKKKTGSKESPDIALQDKNCASGSNSGLLCPHFDKSVLT